MTETKMEKEISINFWRQHIIEGLMKARRDAGRVIEIIKTDEDPKKTLMEKLLFTDYQAQCIIELNRPVDEIEEELLVAEQQRLRAEEVELKRPNKEDAPDQKSVR